MLATTSGRLSTAAASHRTSQLAVQSRSRCIRAFAPKPQQKRGSSRGSPQTVCVADVSEANWDTEVLQASTPVLVDFWATWCGPCKLVAPLLDSVEQEYGGSLKVVKVEADPNPTLVEKYQVYGLPTLLLVKDGVVVEGSKIEGAIGKVKLLQYLESHGMAKVNA